ncbi:MAG: hypothetical protein JNK82_22095, partial [Myxococcaceae bacterium]|nr:hypothetical protein [Myxococcaceae bacterium]
VDSGTPCQGAAKTPPNLMKDPSFECGDGPVWSAQMGDVDTAAEGRTGTKSVRGTASATGALSFGVSSVVTSTSGMPYCINLWLKGTATDARYEVLPSVGGQAYSFSPPVTGSWERAPLASNLKLPVAAGASLSLRVRIINGQPGQTIFIDDIDLWESTSGNCDER